MTWKPSRTSLNVLVDGIGLLLMLAIVYTGVLIRYVLPPGSSGRRGGRGLVLWGMDRHDWGGLHFWLAVGVVVLLVLHVALHWSWVCGLWRRWRCTESAPRGAGVASGLAFLLALVLLAGGFTGWSAARVEERLGPHAARELSGGLAERPGPDTDEAVRGFMTLREVADATGVPVDHLRRALGLPEGVSVHLRLGQLRRRFGFQMEDVRRAIADYRRLRAGEG